MNFQVQIIPEKPLELKGEDFNIALTFVIESSYKNVFNLFGIILEKTDF